MLRISNLEDNLKKAKQENGELNMINDKFINDIEDY